MADLKIFTENIEDEAQNEVELLLAQPAFADCKVRIMPDVHWGKGCVIGFTADLGDKVIPNVVGVDIGCGMLTAKFSKEAIDLKKLDDIIHKYIPSGREVHPGRICRFPEIQELKCYRELRDAKKMERAIGSLGGGNHFIEIDRDEEGYKYLIIHTGSRNLGKKVADYYQKLAIALMQGKDELLEKQEKIIKEYKEAGRRDEIEEVIKELHRNYKQKKLTMPPELCYLTGKYREEYLHDMRIAQKFAELNRDTIADIIIEKMGFNEEERFQTIHNYIDHDSNIVRKGAISAKAGERLVIPINMKDGCILGIGKGNKDWNESAPHGAGRIMSRNKAKDTLNMNEYRKAMEGIYSTSVNEDTIDEAPAVYKPIDEILDNIKDTVTVEKVIKPIYNFKASRVRYY